MSAKIRTAIVFQTVTKRFAFKSLWKAGTPDEHYRISHGTWASRAYAAKVARENGFQVEHA